MNGKQLMLEAADLWKSYSGTPAVAGVTLSARPGEIVGLLGPNGAGKSTIIAMACGLLLPDRGTVTIAGEPLTGDDGTAKRKIGFVPQEIALHEQLSAIANLRLFGALYGIAGTLLDDRATAALELVGLADRARHKPATFSGGMKRRLNIACALVHDPDVLLLDEPTVGVDPQSRNAIFANLELLRDRGKALVYTTHYMEEVERLCDRVVIVDHGKVIAADSRDNLRRMLPGQARRRVEIEGVIDDDMLALLAARAITLRSDAPEASLEDVFLHLTGRGLRD